MCGPINPLTIASIAASAGGSMLNARAQNDAIAETNRQNQMATARTTQARNDETARQLAMERQQADTVSQALATVRPEAIAARTDAAAGPTNEIANIMATYNVPTLQGQITSGETGEGIGRIVESGKSRMDGIMQAAARLTSQDAQLRGVQDVLTRMAGDITNVSSNRQGSMNASRLETSIPAASVTPSSTPLGDLLMLGGMLGGGLAGRGAGMKAPMSAVRSVAPAIRLPAGYVGLPGVY